MIASSRETPLPILKKGVKHMNNLKPPTVSMTVRLIDGSIRRFRFSLDGADDVTLGSRMEKGFQSHDLALERGTGFWSSPRTAS